LLQESKYPFLKTIRFYIVGTLTLIVLQTFILHRMDLDWNLSLIDSIISSLILAFYCFDIITIFSYYQPGKENHIFRFLFAIIFAMLYGFTIRWALGSLLYQNEAYLLFLEKSIAIRSVFALLVFSFVTAICWLWNSLTDQKEREKRKVDTEQLAKEAELATLRQKIQPHFLFNSLNSISALAISKPTEARIMIQQLSDFLRGTLNKDEQQFVSLKDELAHLNLYLEIEKVRFGHRLNIKTHAEAAALDLTIPPLLIQPIVENAIKFGLYGTLEETHIDIDSFTENNYLFVRVNNPFDESMQHTNAGTGFGLSSIQRRLFLLYARTDLLTTEKSENKFITTLKIPQPK
jgi:two-component system, LytTR family, sensor kinase